MSDTRYLRKNRMAQKDIYYRENRDGIYSSCNADGYSVGADGEPTYHPVCSLVKPAGIPRWTPEIRERNRRKAAQKSAE